jgi:hypothetical protein
MKQVLLILIVAALPASAQWRRFGPSVRPAAHIGAGFTTPVNPLGARLDNGWNIAGGVGVTSDYVGVMFDVMFTDMSFNRRTLQRSGIPGGGQQYVAFTVNPIVHINERGPVDFYLTGGGGLYGQITRYRLRFGRGPFGYDDDFTGSDSLYKPGVNGGVGFAFRLGERSRAKLFAEARFHHMFTRGSGASFIPVTLGVRF